MNYQHPSSNKKGVALMLVLMCVATLAIFLSEITYTAQVNQKLSYDRSDQIKAHYLAKSGFKLALLRIKGYFEIKSTIKNLLKDNAGATPPALEQIWSAPIIIPFSGPLDQVPKELRGFVEKMRKESSFEGILQIRIQSESQKLNINSLIPDMGYYIAKTKTDSKTEEEQNPLQNITNPSNPQKKSEQKKKEEEDHIQEVRKQFLENLTTLFQEKSKIDPLFEEVYRNYNIENLYHEILAWVDLTYDRALASKFSDIQPKQAPLFDISELKLLPSMDDEIYALLSQNFTATYGQGININSITERPLRLIFPQLTEKDVVSFFEYRDGSDNNLPHPFSDGESLTKWLASQTEGFRGNSGKAEEALENLRLRGTPVITEENAFRIIIDTQVHETKKHLEALVRYELPVSSKKTADIEPLDSRASDAAEGNPSSNSSVIRKSKLGLQVLFMRFF